MKKLILSSSSRFRRILLERLQIPFTVVSPDVDETVLPGEDAMSLVRRLSECKARITAERHPDALIIGCDLVGTLNDMILNKPLTHENAVKQLQMVSGKMVRFLSGICLLDAATQQMQLSVETYDVYFRELSLEMIETYLHKEEPLQCAGSFQAEGLGITLIRKFQGDDYTALVGLPLIRLVEMLEKAH